MSNLYENTLAIAELDEMIETQLEAGESAEDIAEIREGIMNVISKDSASVVKWVRVLDSDIDLAKQEIKRLQSLVKSKEKKKESLKGYLLDNMQILGKKKLETYLGNITVRKGTGSVSILDESKIPDLYKREVIEVKIDKDGIKKAIKAGDVVEGAEVVYRDSIIFPKPKKGSEE